MKRILLTLLFVCVSLPVLADGGDKSRRGTFALTNARLITVTNGVIDSGTLIIEDGRIVAVGTDISVPQIAEVLDLGGKSVYPGFIDSGTRLGLVEVSSVAETSDFREVGMFTPQMKALTAVNPNAVAIPVTRVSGVTTVLTEPGGSLFPGTAALIDLHGYTPKQMHVAGVEAVIVEFPTAGRRGFRDQRTDEEVERQYKQAVEQLTDIWNRALLYHRIDSAYAANPSGGHRPEYVPEMEAMIPAVRGEQKLIIKVDRAQDIEAAIEWIREQKIPNAVLSGVREGWRVADKIAAAGLPVLAGPVHAIASRGSDRYDKPYANAGLLAEAGVLVALRTGETENVRNLPFHAGFAAAYGLGKDEALRSITINPARIFGVDDEIGSLEVGKRATLFISDGDPFEPRTTIEQVFIDGYMIPMTNRHIRLYDEFLDRQPGAR